ncbi:MATE family efflux transporter [Vibrio viridaestus]|uniref:Multidrug resistance protein NorM n=1 Tax=Vibrio viridaestus TaxID=2487322 RepID=A0A3N9TCT4_9VIBR|nr:MATE family efflux transporter [Vibrio viridaestus]RQW61315.1 MATE family efflux transporter [Vibrio viridaestus]
MHDKHGLLTDPISDVLRRMTIPMTLGMIAILMFNLVDTFFISLLGTEALAAVSYTFPITFGINCITMGIGVGLSIHIGKLLGQGDGHRAAIFATHGIILALLLVSVTSALGISCLTPLFSLLGAPAHLLPLINDYMFIWYLAIPLLVLPMTGNSAIRATGNTKTPAQIMVFSGFINGALDPLLIFGYGPFPELGIQGAAIASAISWLFGLLASLYVLTIKEKRLARPSISTVVSDWKAVLSVGTPAALSTAMNPISGAVLMTLLSTFGTSAVAAYGAAQRVESILLLVLMSLTSALTPFLAQNLGAKNYQRTFSGLFLSMRFAIIFQFFIFLMMVPISSPLAHLFSQEPTVKHLLWQYLIIVPISYGFQGIIMMLVSAMNAFHKPLQAFLWNFMRLFAFVLPGAWIGSSYLGIEGLFIGIAVGNIIGGILGYMNALRLRKEKQITDIE